MADRVFVDTDVIIDLLIDRQPHSIPASQVFDLAERDEIELCTSILSFNNVHYIVRKVVGEAKTREIIKDILEIIDVLGAKREDLVEALNSEFKDFEDALQHSVAHSDSRVKAIVTRNVKDYKASTLPVFNPQSFINIYHQQ